MPIPAVIILQAAFSTGYVAGEKAAEYVTHL